jgi:hypothetical protein
MVRCEELQGAWLLVSELDDHQAQRTGSGALLSLGHAVQLARSQRRIKQFSIKTKNKYKIIYILYTYKPFKNKKTEIFFVLQRLKLSDH